MTFFDIFSNKKIKEKEIVKIVVDCREKNSLVASELLKMGFAIEFKQLPVADYIVNETAIERKTISDLKSSIIDKRIISQLNGLKQYAKHLLILEGIKNKNIYEGNMHANAFRGFLLGIALNFKTPIIYSLDEEDTAKYIGLIANKKNNQNQESIRPNKSSLSKEEYLQFILEGFPQVGPATAKKLIKDFKNLKEIANSSKEQLENLVGKKAEKIYEIFNQEFQL